MTLADLRALVERMTPGSIVLDPWIRRDEATERGIAALRTLAPALLGVAEAGRVYRVMEEREPTMEHPSRVTWQGKLDRAAQSLDDALAALDRAMEEMR